MEYTPIGVNQKVRCSAADIQPVQLAQVSLQLDAIKFAITQESHTRLVGHHRRDLRQQGLMGRLWEMAFGCRYNHPAQRQSTPVIDHTHHQGQATATHRAAVHHDLEWLSSQCGQQFFGDRQKPAGKSMSIVFEPAAERSITLSCLAP